MLIHWSDKYSTGVPEIDSQHKEIINQLNRLHEAITSGLGNDVILDILEFAGQYASKHFAYEEDCMTKYNCPVASRNKKEHEFFIKQFERIKKRVAEDDIDAAAIIEVYSEFRDWIKNHILGVDTQIRSCISVHK